MEGRQERCKLFGNIVEFAYRSHHLFMDVQIREAVVLVDGSGSIRKVHTGFLILVSVHYLGRDSSSSLAVGAFICFLLFE